MKNEIFCHHTGKNYPYTVSIGLDTMMTLSLNDDWSAAKSEAINELRKLYPNGMQESESGRILTEYGLTDYGWNWVNKIAHCSSKEYEWFYLIAEGKVQAVCIIYHPKSSIIDGENIFYIDYIASAYWNRNRPGYKRRFSSAGTKLISFAVDHATAKLGYRPGFSLHSLPTAEAYYRRIGMTPYECDPQKENLRYFEANITCANSIREAKHA